MRYNKSVIFIYLTFLFLPVAYHCYGQTGIIVTVAGTGSEGYSGDGGAAAACELSHPKEIVFDNSGNLFVADENNFRIRKMDATSGVISTFYNCGASNAPAGIATDGDGNIFYANRPSNKIFKLSPTGTLTTYAGNGGPAFSGDGGPATSARINHPADVTIDADGNVYIADQYNHRIRKVQAGTQIISTFAGNGTAGFNGDGGAATAASLHLPTGVSTDNAGNVYIADNSNHRIRKVAVDGTITTVAGTGVAGFGGDGGPANTAALYNPTDVTTDGRGALYIADLNNNRIRKVDVDGNISTIAGNGFTGYSGDGGSALDAMLYFPSGITVNAAGNLYIADQLNHRIRMVTGVTGTNDINPRHAIDIFPNPAKWVTTVTSPTNIFNRLRVTDQLGRIIYSCDVTGQETRIDLSTIPPGCYLLTMQGDNNAVSKKLLKY